MIGQVSQIQVERVVGLVLGWTSVHATRVVAEGGAAWRVSARDLDGRPVRAVFDEAELRHALRSLADLAEPMLRAA